MYSRMPSTPPWGGSTGPREPSYRRTHTVPPNYSGIAFGPDGDAVPCPLRGEGRPNDAEGNAASCPQGETPAALADVAAETEGSTATAVAVTSHGNSPAAGGERSSFLDHGIGYEELLILGLMVFLMNECDGEGDFKETLILLGLLLLGG